jgi:hypothetical protein
MLPRSWGLLSALGREDPVQLQTLPRRSSFSTASRNASTLVSDSLVLSSVTAVASDDIGSPDVVTPSRAVAEHSAPERRGGPSSDPSTTPTKNAPFSSKALSAM